MNPVFKASLALSQALAVALLAAPALAAGDAPDPFDDYEVSHPGAPPVEAITPPTRPGAEARGGDRVDVPWKRGNWQVGGFGMFAYAGSNSDLVSGAEESNVNSFLRLSPRASYFVLDNLEVAASLGLMRKSINREEKTLSSETSFLAEGAVHYALPVTPRFALIPGAGLGFYLGSSERPTSLASQSLNETTESRGVALSLYPMVAYQLAPDWQLRSGLAVTLMYGSERVASINDRLATSAAYVSLPVQIAYTFH